MSVRQGEPVKTKSVEGTWDLAGDLAWIDMLKGVAIVGVFFDNWNGYMLFKDSPGLLGSLIKHFPWGPFVQLFFILSGFGLAVTYFGETACWDWKRWAWRRITKIVVPYVIAVFFSFVLGIIGSWLYPSIEMQFSWRSLVAYLTFARNFFPFSWGWNITMWFMPVIIGLYVSFPILIKVLEKWGSWVLLLISILITYGTITIAVLVAPYRGHQADLFSFWLAQFSLGIVLAYTRYSNPKKLHSLITVKAFLLGTGLFAFSWALQNYLPLGKVYNDLFTSVGIFLILLNVCRVVCSLVPAVGRVLRALSSKSYLMYLVHYPILTFLIGPLLRSPANAATILVLGSIYIAAIFGLCCLASRPIHRFTVWLYQRYRPTDM